MSKSDEYRANAQECERMAGITRNQADKITWLQMAAHWLRLIPTPKPSASERFDAEERAVGTHQTATQAEN
jgi:hypothetical protein